LAKIEVCGLLFRFITLTETIALFARFVSLRGLSRKN